MTALTPRPGIMKIAPYVPGKDSVDGKEPIAKLSSNESAMGPSPKAMAAYIKVAAELHRYPDGGAEKLRAAIGRRYGLDPARIICGCGSDELLNLLIRAYCGPGDELIYSQYGFLMYPINALGVGESEVTVSGDRQIIVSVPNVQQDQLVQQVGQTAVLRFREVYAAEQVQPPVPEPSATESSAPTPAPKVTRPASKALRPNPSCSSSGRRKGLAPTPTRKKRPPRMPARKLGMRSRRQANRRCSSAAWPSTSNAWLDPSARHCASITACSVSSEHMP